MVGNILKIKLKKIIRKQNNKIDELSNLNDLLKNRLDSIYIILLNEVINHKENYNKEQMKLIERIFEESNYEQVQKEASNNRSD